MQRQPTTTNYDQWITAIRSKFTCDELNMSNSQIIDICHEFRSLDEAIEYFSTHDLTNLWVTPRAKPSPEVTRKHIEQREAAEKRKQDRLSAWRKAKKEQKQKPPVQPAQPTEPRPVFARPSTTTTWSQLTKNPAFAPPPVSAPPPAKPPKPNPFVWNAADVETQRDTANAVPPAEESITHFVWKAPDPDQTAKTELAPNHAIAVASPAEAELETGRTQTKSAPWRSRGFRRAGKVGVKPEELPISAPENEFRGNTVAVQTENQQKWETPSMTIASGMREEFSPVLSSDAWVLDENEGWK